MNTTPLRVSTVSQEPPFQASKWISMALLIDREEMGHLLNELGNFSIVLTSGLTQPGKEILSHQDFLGTYGSYVEELKAGKIPSEIEYRSVFSSAWTQSLEALYAVKVGNGQHLVRICKPVVQLQPHGFEYSSLDGKFRSMVLGERMTWGIQFSYPQLFQNPQTHAVEQVLKGEGFPNTALFRTLQKWVRHFTQATPFVVNGKRINVPIRLGKQCFSWINRHPQFSSRGLTVEIIP